jgi:nucleotide-binding universal stress UspA family protein
VDLQPSSAGALQWAARFAEVCHARLTLVHVTTNSPAARRALDALQKDVGSHAAVRIESGDPAEVVALVAQELNADVLVIGRATPSEFLGRLGMTEYSIIRQSPCPVISV